MEQPILIAHRGGSLEAPENTLASFRHAIELGIRFVELDVQMSRDGELIVLHDETVDRTTDGHGSVFDFNLEDLRKLDAGSHFGPQFAGEPIPTLREVLELCTAANVGVVVELKSPALYPGMIEKVVALAGQTRRGAGDIWCISFDHQAIRQVRALDPDIPLGYLYEYFEQEFVQADDNIQAYCPYFGTALARPDQIANAHKLGKRVLVYTVNEEQDIGRVLAAGIDGLVSDRPTLLKRLLG